MGVLLCLLPGGVNWSACQASFGLDLLLLDIDAVDNVSGDAANDCCGLAYGAPTVTHACVFYFPTAQTVVIAGPYGEMFSTDGGRSWR